MQKQNGSLLTTALENSNFLSHFSFPAGQYAQLFHAEAGEHITEDGEELAYLYYMVSGRAKLYFTLPNGKISLIDFFEAPCFVGEMELLGAHTKSRAMQALVPCTCLALPVRRCRTLLLNDPVFLRHLCFYLAGKNNRNTSALAQNQTFPLANRLAAFLLLAAPGGIYREKHTQAAEYLGVSYRHLLYVLAGFTAQGFIKKEKSGYCIVNKAALLCLAQGMDPQAFS
ncbi:MAG: transcriptional regulator YeiL [Oscillospiraceae bacterium]